MWIPKSIECSIRDLDATTSPRKPAKTLILKMVFACSFTFLIRGCAIRDSSLSNAMRLSRCPRGALEAGCWERGKSQPRRRTGVVGDFFWN